MKVNAGGSTHQYKLEVDSVFNVFTLRINFMHLRACILGDYPVPRHMWIGIVAESIESSQQGVLTLWYKRGSMVTPLEETIF